MLTKLRNKYLTSSTSTNKNQAQTMAYNIFVSYKYNDSNVESLNSSDYTTARSYVDELEEVLGDFGHRYFGEHDGEDISKLTEEEIWNKLKDKIFPTSITLVMISADMVDCRKNERDQWIPWEISYSIRETERNNRTSSRNALLAVVLPDRNGTYDHFVRKENWGGSIGEVNVIRTDRAFHMIGKNMFNAKDEEPTHKEIAKGVWIGDVSYIQYVRWKDFKSTPNVYLDKASEIRGKADMYNLTIQVPNQC